MDLAIESAVFVVPAFNEAKRLDSAQFRAAVRCHGLRFLFVDDGSTDGTAALLRDFCRSDPEHLAWMQLECNYGKAEAVRRGMLSALEMGCDAVGYFDADGATPAAELDRLLQAMNEGGVKVVLGSRVRLLGRTIERSAVRHYGGRVFATIASLVLRLPVYDTQCGAKLFRTCDSLRTALEQPFRTTWVFDVELIGRLLYGGKVRLSRSDFLELPLGTWMDVRGSKVKLRDGIVAAWHLFLLGLQMRSLRAALKRTRAS